MNARLFLLLPLFFFAIQVGHAAGEVLQNGVPFNTSLSARTYANAAIAVPVGAQKLTVSLTNGSGDLDLYVKYGSPVQGSTVPELDADTDFLADGPTANETIVVTPASNPPLRAGNWYVATLNQNYEKTTFTLTATVTGGDDDVSEPAPEASCQCAHFDASSNVAHVPSIRMGSTDYWADFSLISHNPIQVRLIGSGVVDGGVVCAAYDQNRKSLHVPCLDLTPTNLQLDLALVGKTPPVLQLQGYQAATGEQVWNLEPLLNQSVVPAEQDQVISAGSYVAVTVPGGELQEPRQLKVSKVTDPAPFPFAGAGDGRFLDITLAGKSTFGQPVVLEFPFASLGSATGVPDEVGVSAAYWDAEVDTWVFIDKEVDRTNGVIRLHTDHLSTWTWMDSWDWDSVSSPSGAFTVYYDPGFPGPTFSDGRFPTNYEFAEMLADELDAARAAYQAAGFRVPSSLNVMMFYNKEQDPLYVSPWLASNSIYFSYYSYRDLQHFRSVVGHELFHAVQNRYVSDVTQMRFRRWFIEATADLAADLYRADGSGATLKQLRGEFFSLPLATAGKNREYEIAPFLHYLVEDQGVDFRDMWESVAALWTGSTLSALEDLVQAQTGRALFGHWQDFVIKAHFSNPQLFKGSNAGTFEYLYEGLHHVIDDKTPSKQVTLDLAEDYSAALWTIRAKADASGKDRKLTIQPLQEIPAGKTVRLFRISDVRNFTDKSAAFLDELAFGQSSGPITLSKDDALCVLGINGHGPSSRIPLRVTDSNLTVDLGGGKTVPPGGAITITPSVTGGTPPYTYAWQGDGMDMGSGSTLTIKSEDMAQGLTLSLTVTDANGLSDTDTVTVQKGYAASSVTFQDKEGKWTVTMDFVAGPTVTAKVTDDPKSVSGQLVTIKLDGFPTGPNSWPFYPEVKITVSGSGLDYASLFTNSTKNDQTFSKFYKRVSSDPIKLGGHSYYWLNIYSSSGNSYSRIVFELVGSG